MFNSVLRILKFLYITLPLWPFRLIKYGLLLPVFKYCINFIGRNMGLFCSKRPRKDSDHDVCQQSRISKRTPTSTKSRSRSSSKSRKNKNKHTGEPEHRTPASFRNDEEVDVSNEEMAKTLGNARNRNKQAPLSQPSHIPGKDQERKKREGKSSPSMNQISKPSGSDNSGHSSKEVYIYIPSTVNNKSQNRSSKNISLSSGLKALTHDKSKPSTPHVITQNQATTVRKDENVLPKPKRLNIEMVPDENTKTENSGTSESNNRNDTPVIIDIERTNYYLPEKLHAQVSYLDQKQSPENSMISQNFPNQNIGPPVYNNYLSGSEEPSVVKIDLLNYSVNIAESSTAPQPIRNSPIDSIETQDAFGDSTYTRSPSRSNKNQTNRTLEVANINNFIGPGSPTKYPATFPYELRGNRNTHTFNQEIVPYQDVTMSIAQDNTSTNFRTSLKEKRLEFLYGQVDTNPPKTPIDDNKKTSHSTSIQCNNDMQKIDPTDQQQSALNEVISNLKGLSADVNQITKAFNLRNKNTTSFKSKVQTENVSVVLSNSQQVTKNISTHQEVPMYQLEVSNKTYFGERKERYKNNESHKTNLQEDEDLRMSFDNQEKDKNVRLVHDNSEQLINSKEKVLIKDTTKSSPQPMDYHRKLDASIGHKSHTTFKEKEFNNQVCPLVNSGQTPIQTQIGSSETNQFNKHSIEVKKENTLFPSETILEDISEEKDSVKSIQPTKNEEIKYETFHKPSNADNESKESTDSISSVIKSRHMETQVYSEVQSRDKGSVISLQVPEDEATRNETLNKTSNDPNEAAASKSYTSPSAFIENAKSLQPKNEETKAKISDARNTFLAKTNSINENIDNNQQPTENLRQGENYEINKEENASPKILKSDLQLSLLNQVKSGTKMNKTSIEGESSEINNEQNEHHVQGDKSRDDNNGDGISPSTLISDHSKTDKQGPPHLKQISTHHETPNGNSVKLIQKPSSISSENDQPREPVDPSVRRDEFSGNVLSQKAYDAVLDSLEAIKMKALPFNDEIDNFTDLEDSNKHYYIEESLRRLIDKLDDMFDDIGEVKALRDARKKVYRIIFPMFERLDAKVQENRQNKHQEG